MKILKSILFSMVCLLGGTIALNLEARGSSVGTKIREKMWRVVDGKDIPGKANFALDEKILGRGWQNRMAALLLLSIPGLLLDKKVRGDKSLLSGGGHLWNKVISKFPESIKEIGRAIADIFPESTGTRAFLGVLGALASLLSGNNDKERFREWPRFFAFLMTFYNPALVPVALFSPIPQR